MGNCFGHQDGHDHHPPDLVTYPIDQYCPPSRPSIGGPRFPYQLPPPYNPQLMVPSNLPPYNPELIVPQSYNPEYRPPPMNPEYRPPMNPEYRPPPMNPEIYQSGNS